MWQSGNRKGSFIAGVIILVVSLGFILINQLTIFNWKEAPVTNAQVVGSCSKSATSYMYTYEVDEKEYKLKACTNSAFTSVTYNPAKPSEAVVNTYVVYQIIAIVCAILGAILMLGGLFLRDDAVQSQRAENFFKLK